MLGTALLSKLTVAVLLLNRFTMVGCSHIGTCLGWMLLSLAVIETATGHLAQESSSADQPLLESSCRIYMAPSTLPYGGNGIFTTAFIEEGESFLRAPDGPSIPVVDYQHPYREHNWIRRFDSYWWDRGVSDSVRYEAWRIADFQVTFGSLPNHHCVLDSIHHTNPPDYDFGYLDWTVDPGVGAFSQHPGRDFSAIFPLDPGDEIFLNYGHCGDRVDVEDFSFHDEPVNSDRWECTIECNEDNINTIGTDDDCDDDDDDDDAKNEKKQIDEVQQYHDEDIEQLDWTDRIAQNSDYLVAAEIAHSMYRIVQAHERREGVVSRMQFRVWMETEKAKQEDMITPHVLDLLPKDVRTLKQAVRGRRGDHWKDLASSLSRSALARRTPKWIAENGMCLENLIPKHSTLPQAGLGAFAQFAISQGEVVVPVPLLHISDRDVLKMTAPDSFFPDRKLGYQLLLNYCFGDTESSLLLCPLTNAILINHCSERSKTDCSGPNAKIQWASGWEPKLEEWLELSLEELQERSDRGLAFEVVATQDIVPGEEVFIDYGEEWESAWEKHVLQWPELVESSSRKPESPLSLHKLNYSPGPLTFLVAGNARSEEFTKDDVFTGCIYWFTDEDDLDVYFESNKAWMHMADEEIVQKYGTDGSQFLDSYETHRDYSYWPCSILLQENPQGSTYTVRIHQTHFDEEAPWDEHQVPRILTNYPRESIHYFHMPYKSDQHLDIAFRHHIGMPHEMLPESWKDRKVPRRKPDRYEP